MEADLGSIKNPLFRKPGEKVDENLFPKSSDFEIIRSGYLFRQKIGAGKFGCIYKGYDVLKERNVAIKAINLAKEKEFISPHQNTGSKEVEIYKYIESKREASEEKRGAPEDTTEGYQNIIKYYSNFRHYEENMLYIIMELGGFNLYSLLVASRKDMVTERSIEMAKINITRQLAKGVSFLQKISVIHRDIKPENVILFKSGDVKICDFGFALVYDQKNQPDNFIGTLDYLAPEIVKCSRSKTPYGPEVDLWALGVTVYELFVGKTPFYNNSERETLINILMFNDKLSYQHLFVPPIDICRFLCKLMKYSAKERVLDMDALGKAPMDSPRSLDASGENTSTETSPRDFYSSV